MFWSTMMRPTVALGVLGTLLLAFPDAVVSTFWLRIAVSWSLLTVFGVLFAVFVVLRRAVTSPMASIGVSTLLAFVSFIGSSLGWGETLQEYNRYLVLVLVCCGLGSVVAATYIDSSLGSRHQKLVVIGCGVGACIVAATFEYPQFISVIADSVLYIFLFLLKRIIGVNRQEKPPMTKEDDPVPSQDTEQLVPEPEEKQHPLVFNGLIVNPETMRNIKIGAKTYSDLIAQGYRPDFSNGILVRERKRRVTIA